MHPTDVTGWSRAKLDRTHFSELLLRDLDDGAWQELAVIAGQHVGRAAAPDEGVPLPEVRLHLQRTLDAVARLDELFDVPAGKALRLELDFLDDFICERAEEFRDVSSRAPLAIDKLLVTLSERLTLLSLAHRAAGPMEGSFGYAHRTSWNMLVVALSRWCADNAIPTKFHARSGDAPVFRRLVAEIDALLPEEHRQKFQAVETEIRAIERALAPPTS